MPKYDLDELIEGMTPENTPKEIDWGPAVGNEFPNGYPEDDSLEI